jgi:hypothetical protein
LGISERVVYQDSAGIAAHCMPRLARHDKSAPRPHNPRRGKSLADPVEAAQACMTGHAPNGDVSREQV